MTTSEVRAMRPDDAKAASAISAEAGERFRAITDARIAACADDSPFGVEELNAYIDGGRAWVATEDDEVVGFVILNIVDGRAHIEEVDVAPTRGRRGHGSRLMDEVAHWARSTGLEALTLTTFRDVPWNMPWYGRLGFRVLTCDELTPELRRGREDEHTRGLPTDLRVVMRLDLADHP